MASGTGLAHEKKEADKDTHLGVSPRNVYVSEDNTTKQ